MDEQSNVLGWSIPEVAPIFPGELGNTLIAHPSTGTSSIQLRQEHEAAGLLPEIGIKGNTHFIFSDLNNIQIADLVSKFLADKGLDR